MQAALAIQQLEKRPIARKTRVEELQRQLDKMFRRLRMAVIYAGDKSRGDSVLYPSSNPRSWKSYESVARDIADALDDAGADDAVSLIVEANSIVAQQIVKHEREDETKVYPDLAKYLSDGHGLGAMGRAHREIMHLSRLLGQLAQGLAPADVDRYLIRDAQRVIESVEALVRIHNAQEEDIYEHAERHL